MSIQQSWKTCKHGVAAGSGEMSYELREHRLYETYNCENKEIINLGIYPTQEIIDENGSFTKIALLHSIMIADSLSENAAKKLEAMVQNALTCCKHCKFHESK